MIKNTLNIINDMVAKNIIERYAIGGAIGATFYVEAFSTDDIDVFIPVSISKGGLIILNPIYEHLKGLGYKEVDEKIHIEGWDVQFLSVYDELTEEGLLNAIEFDLGGVSARVMLAEHLVAIMLKTGRAKDFARVKMFIDQGKVDLEELKDLIKRFELEGQWQKYKLRL